MSFDVSVALTIDGFIDKFIFFLFEISDNSEIAQATSCPIVNNEFNSGNSSYNFCKFYIQKYNIINKKLYKIILIVFKFYCLQKRKFILLRHHHHWQLVQQFLKSLPKFL